MGSVEFLCGPAGSGKTTEMLRLYAEQAARGGQESVMMIVASARAREEAMHSLVVGGGMPQEGLLDPLIFTFQALAEAATEANHVPVRQMSDMQQRMMLADVIREVSGQGGMPNLDELLNFNGFVNAIAQLITELKNQRIDAETFARIAGATLPGYALNADISAVYARYQERLKERNLHDKSGALWELCELLAQGKTRPVHDVELVLVDGFHEINGGQMEVLKLLAAGAKRTVISLCLCEGAEDGGRAEIGATVDETRRRIENALGAGNEYKWAPCCADGVLAQVRARVFSDSAELMDGSEAPLELVSAPGPRAEIRQIARRIKQMLVSGVAQAGEIGLLVRSLDSYEMHIRHAFDEYGVPFEIGRGTPLHQVPVVQAALDVLNVVTNGYRREDVVQLLKSSYVDIAKLQADGGEPLSGDRFEQVALEAQIIGGQEHWKRQFEILGKRLQDEYERVVQGEAEDEEGTRLRTAAVIEDEQSAREQCANIFEHLTNLLEKIENAKTREQAVSALSNVINELGIVARCCDEPDASMEASHIRDIKGMTSFSELLREYAEAPKVLGVSVDLAPGEFGRDLREICNERLDGDAHTCTAVQVMEVNAAIGLRFGHVFLAGLVEGGFPRAGRDDPFYNDEQREKLNEYAGKVLHRGAILPQMKDQHAMEAFMFYRVLGMAQRSLTLTWPASDAGGSVLLRSHFVDEVQALFAEDTLAYSEVKRGDVIPAIEDISSGKELLESTLYWLWQAVRPVEVTGSRVSAGAEALRAGEGEASRLLRRSVIMADIERERYSDRWSEYDGEMQKAETQEKLAAQFDAQHEYSASALGAYGKCPMRFFLERVLDLNELEEPDEDLQAKDIGSIMHSVLARFFRERQEGRDNCHPLEEGELAREKERIARLLAEELRRAAGKGMLPHDALREVLRGNMEADLHAVLEHEIDMDRNTKLNIDRRTIYRTEEGFSHVEIPCGDETILVRGRIDRIDQIDVAGVMQYWLIDYKLSGAPSNANIIRKMEFQMPIYVWAMIGSENVGVGLEDVGAWFFYRVRRPVQEKYRVTPEKSRNAPPLEELLEIAKAGIAQHVQSIRMGKFNTAPRQADCTRYCPLKEVCRYSEYRIARKTAASEPAIAGGEGE